MQIQCRMADFNSTTPPIPIMDSTSQLHSRMARHKYNIQFYKSILLDNYARSQQSGEISHYSLHNKNLQNIIHQHKVLLQTLQSQLSSLTTPSPPIFTFIPLPTIPTILHTTLSPTPALPSLLPSLSLSIQSTCSANSTLQQQPPPPQSNTQACAMVLRTPLDPANGPVPTPHPIRPPCPLPITGKCYPCLENALRRWMGNVGQAQDVETGDSASKTEKMTADGI